MGDKLQSGGLRQEPSAHTSRLHLCPAPVMQPKSTSFQVLWPVDPSAQGDPAQLAAASATRLANLLVPKHAWNIARIH